MYKIPSFLEYINEGVLSNYRTEREGMRITYQQMEGTFEEVLDRLVKEKIPFYFDCTYKNYSKIGYLMNESINNTNFNGYILDGEKNSDETCEELKSILKDTVIDKQQGKLYVGRSNFCDLTKASDLDTIFVVVKAIKSYVKDNANSLGDQKRVITGNKQEVKINIDFLCDRTRSHDFIEYVF